MRAWLVSWLIFVHTTAIVLFTRGFLLSRLALSDVSQPPTGAHARPQQTHSRAVVLIIDALRWDFLSPHPPDPPNPYYHNVLTLPAELTQKHPEHSFLFNAYADPPTTTLQRIKGLTTGSLPTFVDIGSNFGGSAILEDTIIGQLVAANKTVAFMGDDTWLSVFPTSFHPNLTFPYDSFNVEDLHTVDAGVLTHLFPLLLNSHPSLPLATSTNQTQFDVLIGHFLGVDHVGHRVGPSHPSMHSKLTQLDTALRKVVDLLDDDTLLVVLGDHGMDRAGDHGGDSTLETSSALWVYSKGRALTDVSDKIFSGLMKYDTFPGEKMPARSVQQIDLVPSLSLLLGLPVPYNNLGTVIPELFWRHSPSLPPTTKKSKKGQRQTLDELELEKALAHTTHQIHTYLETYRASSSGAELDSSWATLQNAWDAISIAPQLASSSVEAKLTAMSMYTRTALSSCRSIWAQFNAVLMAAGLALMLTGLVTTWVLYLSLRLDGPGRSDKVLNTIAPFVWKTTCGSGVGVYALAYCVTSFLPTLTKGIPMSPLEISLFTAPMLACVFVNVYIVSQPQFTFGQLRRRGVGGKGGVFAVLLLVFHFLSFFSNSFTFWEEKVVLWLAVSSVVPIVLCGIAAPGLSSTSTTSADTTVTPGRKPQPKQKSIWGKLGLASLRGKILGFTFLFLVCIRLMSLVTVCREEQGAYCHVTFYATPSAPSAPPPPDTTATNANATTGPAPMTILPTSTTPPTWSLFLSLPTTLILPVLMTRVLRITKSDKGLAPGVMWGVVAPALIGSWVFWFMEWVESGAGGADGLLGAVAQIVEGIEGFIRLRTVRSWIARAVMAWLSLGFVAWWLLPVCLDIRVSTSPAAAAGKKTQVTILGYANAYGAPCLLLYLLCFALVYLCTPLPGQIVLGLSAVALVAYLEALDGVRDVWEIERVVGRALDPSTAARITAAAADGRPTRGDQDEVGEENGEEEPASLITTLPLILLSFITFYATGHESTASSLQWKTGFVLSESVRYPWSVVTVVLNSAGAFFVVGAGGAALLAGWKRSPVALDSPPTPRAPASTSASAPSRKPQMNLGTNIEHSTLLNTLLIQLYFFALLFGASTSAAILRRHLMVWKVFAPRFIAAVVQLGVVDFGLVVAWGIPLPGIQTAGSGAVGRVVERVGWVLGRVGIGRSDGGEKEE
ncbi:hypothetical protein P691DRAFT_810558 [Macrolepiota fuliginosa MF-IS2]|uniref:GPI ethanolamine phosphate transferase 3 n=1 Tax=Macrolepiota fuliginosa MF-IS2 TaxID=1400762 RepID=A0A9P5X1Y7_9AGAR|nr:hypothetical protein P691DRAFT_810558 [Macrolepiota fuliginosa MF-IS2]